MARSGSVPSANARFDVVERLVVRIAPGLVSSHSYESAQKRAKIEQLVFDIFWYDSLEVPTKRIRASYSLKVNYLALLSRMTSLRTGTRQSW